MYLGLDLGTSELKAVMDLLHREQPQALSALRGVGLSGQMHGATLLDENDAVLRPAILWNDGRSGPQCEQLTRDVPDLAAITGNLAMPGFTAPHQTLFSVALT